MEAIEMDIEKQVSLEDLMGLAMVLRTMQMIFFIDQFFSQAWRNVSPTQYHTATMSLVAPIFKCIFSF